MLGTVKVMDSNPALSLTHETCLLFLQFGALNEAKTFKVFPSQTIENALDKVCC
jgi:hypothetical protein